MSETIYKWADGWDVAVEDLEVVYQQPQVDLVGPVVRNYSPGGAIYDQGLVSCYRFQMVEDEATMLGILAQIDLVANDTSPVTFLARDSRLTLRKYNGVAQAPEGNQDIKLSNFFPRDMAVYLVDVEEAA